MNTAITSTAPIKIVKRNIDMNKDRQPKGTEFIGVRDALLPPFHRGLWHGRRFYSAFSRLAWLHPHAGRNDQAFLRGRRIETPVVVEESATLPSKKPPAP